MNPIRYHKRPIISICVPTFNRASCLKNLFKNLEEIKRTYGIEIEICVSNNQSTDSTPQVIETWRDKLALEVVTQPKNIGATLNGIEVVRLATGKWILIIGDDDELISTNFKKLLEYLQSAEEGDWILAGVTDKTGKGNLLGDLNLGRYEAKAFRRTLLRTGLYRFGFIGMHIFPSVLRPIFFGFMLEGIQSWPHIALFLRHLQGGRVRVFPAPVVKQAAGGAELFWNAGDWVRANLRKLDIVAAARRAIKCPRCFFDGLILRELYSLMNIKELVKWKVLEPSDFHHKAFSEYIARYLLVGPLTFLVAVHCMFLLVIYVTPSNIFRVALRLIGKEDYVFRYISQKEIMSRFDGVKRGL